MNAVIKDCLQIIMPLVLSVIAIVISIFVAIKQNKIALFEKRYMVLTKTKAILSFEVAICDCRNIKPEMVLSLYDIYFPTESYIVDDYIKMLDSVARARKVKDQVLMSRFLFKDSKNKAIYKSTEELTGLFVEIIADASVGEIDQDKIKSFHEVCGKYYQTEFHKMVKETELYIRR